MTATASDGGLMATAHRRLVVGVVIVMTFVAFEQMSVATALPAVLRDLGGVALYGWAFGAFTLGQVVGIVFTGPAVDRSGFAPPTLIAGLIFSVGLVLGGLAPSMLGLVAARALQGLGAGAFMVTLNASISAGVAERLRTRAFAVMAMAWVLPSIVGPAVAGVIAAQLSWRLVFLGIVPLVAGGLVIALPALFALDAAAGRAAASGERSAGGWTRTALLGVGMALGVFFVLVALGRHQAWSAALIGAIGLTLVICALRAFLPAAADAGARSQLAAVAVGGVAAFGFFGGELLLPLILTTIHNRSVAEAGTVLTVAAFAWTGGSWALVRVRDRIGSRALCVAGLLLIAAGALCVFAVAWAQTPWEVAFVGWALAPLGMGVITTVTLLVVVDHSHQDAVGEPVATLQVLNALGAATGTGICGAVLGWSIHLGHGEGPGLRVAALAMSVVTVVGIVAAVRLPRDPVVPSDLRTYL